MKFSEVVNQARALLHSKGRITYRALKREFDLDDEALEDLKEELIEAERVAVDENGKILVWAGKGINGETEKRRNGESSPESRVQSLASEGQERSPLFQTLDARPKDARRDSGERRQLTVMFCDLVGSTALSEQLDPEEYREVVSLYQEACTAVIRRYAGHIAQHLGDGLLVYVGYPVAHEDDAQRAVRIGLEILATLVLLNARLPSTIKARLPHPVQVRIGIHTGLVVIGEIGSSEKREVLALGETPNIAARIQGKANPNEVMVSATTYRLVEGLFECEDRGQPTLKGISVPLALYRVIGESAAQSRFEVAVGTGLTQLVGREEELGLLQRRWAQAKEGAGQVVLLSGEPGIGKSRLVQTLKEQALAEGAPRIEFRCSPYHQNSAFYPLIEHLQRLLQFQREDTPHAKLVKLQQMLAAYCFPQAETLSLLAALLSLPQPEDVPLLTLSPQKQKQKTQEALVAWIIEEAQKAAVYCAWEDLHWADPSTLEVLTLFLEQIPTARVFAVLTFRPEFTPPWSARSYLTQLTLNRLGRAHVEAMVENVTGGESLPKEIIQQIVSKTDGVPLFVEELTKSVVESGGAHSPTPLQLGIPATLQDALMARLDRLGPAKDIAQLGATIGREFHYELLRAVSPLDEEPLQQRLRQLVEAELIYQRGLPPQAIYLFKHVLIQDTAYQSLLKSTRQQYHQQIAQVLTERFPETAEIRPELLARHYTEAGLKEQALPYWQQAGNNAWRRHGYREAIEHLQHGLTLVQTLADTPERAEQELLLHIALGGPLMVTKGYAAPEVEDVYARARTLCQRVENPSRLFPVLLGLWGFYNVRAELQTARALAEQLLGLAHHMQEPVFLAVAQHALGNTLTHLGEPVAACAHFEAVLTPSDARQLRLAALPSNLDPTVATYSYVAMCLWLLGYPDRAVQRSQEGVRLAQDLSAPINGCEAGFFAGLLRLFRGEGAAALTEAETLISRSAECGLLFFEVLGRLLRGGALSAQGQDQEGSAQLRHGLEIYQATGARIARPLYLAMLADASGRGGQVAEGLQTLAEAFELTEETGERIYEAELYRLKGELLLTQESQKSKVKAQKSKVNPNPQHLALNTKMNVELETEECFLKAIDIARKQQVKSLELRAVMSLIRLRQQQLIQSGSRNMDHESHTKLGEDHRMLSEIYNWFTEGFDTKDLQEAKALLEEMSQ